MYRLLKIIGICTEINSLKLPLSILVITAIFHVLLVWSIVPHYNGINHPLWLFNVYFDVYYNICGMR